MSLDVARRSDAGVIDAQTHAPTGSLIDEETR
jgi:hypothetical protein